MKANFLHRWNVEMIIPRKSTANLRTYSQFGSICLAVLVASGCQPSTEVGGSFADEETEVIARLPDVPDSGYQFELGVMLYADGASIAVESPGYACPTVVDVDGDGVDDLVVGQFAGGKMKWYRNTANETTTPEYAVGEWIRCDDEPAQVPGVS